MLIIPPPKCVKKPPTIKPPAMVAGTAPNLLSGTVQLGSVLTLVFDQAIAIGTYDGTQVVANVVGTGTLLGTAGVAVSGTSVVINLVPAGGSYLARGMAKVQAAHSTLSVSATSGLVAAAGGRPWAGVSGFVLVVE